MKVLISPGFGAGWSTWNDTQLAIDSRIIEAFEKGMSEEEMQDYCVSLGYESPYMGGYENIEIQEVPSGALFQIREYDGHEYIEVFNPQEWITATD